MLILLAFLLPCFLAPSLLLGCSLICNQYIKGFVPQAQPGCNSLFQQVLSCEKMHLGAPKQSKLKPQALYSHQLGFTEQGIITISARSVQRKPGNHTEFTVIMLYHALVTLLMFCTIYRLTDRSFMAKAA